MAKLNRKNKDYPKSDKKTKANLFSWLENKILRVRKLSVPKAYRQAKRLKTFPMVLLVLGITFASLFLPKNRFQLIKERLIKNSRDYEAHLAMAEEFLKNNQPKEAERELLIVSEYRGRSTAAGKVLGISSKFKSLLEKKFERDPDEIRKLISEWEKIIGEKPNYRDAYLQMAILHYRIYEDDQAKEALNKAIEIDPNYQPARDLERKLKS